MKVKLDKYSIKAYNDEYEYNYYNSIIDLNGIYEVLGNNDNGYSINTKLNYPKTLFFYNHEIKEIYN